MDDARKRKFDIVLVWRFDRFARSTKHLVNALYEFRNLGIDFISYQENIDTSSPLGEAIFTIISAMSKLERDIIAERVKGGLRKARANGITLGRPNSVIDMDKLIKYKEQGMSIREIAKELGLSRGKVERTLKLGVSKTLESCTS
jgi:DNA invertase Pin-like site-specific DNA recombinase